MSNPNSREATPSNTPTVSSLPQKRALEDDHQPAVSSPLNPDFKTAKAEDSLSGRAPRAKKESFKKRESKGASLAPESSSARATPDPKSAPRKNNKKRKDDPAPIRYQLPPPRTSDFDPPRGPLFSHFQTKTLADGTEVQFNETSDHVYNKKGFHYTHCIADPNFPSTIYYRQSETEPFEARLNFEDTSTHMYLDEGGHHVTTDKGWRMAKANVGVREGRWYWECKITSGIPRRKSTDGESTGGHVRLGWARREATLDAPVGFDAYSYGLRDVAGQKVFMSRPKDFFIKGDDIREGDVIGLEINLPSETLHRKVVEGHYNKAVDFKDEGNDILEAATIIRDRVPIRFKAHLYFEQIDYQATKELEELMNPSPVISSSGGVGASNERPDPSHPYPSLRTLPHSNVKIYKNGVEMGTAFEDLLAFLPPASKPTTQVGAREGLDDGMLGYYPAISVFRGGAAQVNLGPKFWFPPEDLETDGADRMDIEQTQTSKLRRLRPLSERYDEQIVEDIVYDIIDEVDWWMRDGGVTGKGVTSGALRSGVATQNGGVQGSEIKELVQDDE
ncbi:hypothetical protein B0O99DRAFT_562279 [Bisporella sp. PMI_857]|nr:hypothetical protein B0O99DRAFT_562279 [Bisporella sp. PMI_857]